MSNRKIEARTYYKIRVALTSPVNIGSGAKTDTDVDAEIIRNSSGECFIPGTSLAGAFRNHFGSMDNSNGLFGFSDGDKGAMSSVFVSDLYFDEGTVVTSIRDRVSLKDDKDVDNKFDAEIIEPGAVGTIALETVQREGDADPDAAVNEVILAIQNGDIRFGADKNRGFGRAEIKTVSRSRFDSSRREEWISYMSGDSSAAGEDIPFEEWKASLDTEYSGVKRSYIRESVPLSLKGGISIRRYSAEPGKADFEQITVHGTSESGDPVPVIPGTSWNGAVRSDAKQILIGLGLKASEAEVLLSKWFGKVKGEDAWQSKIVISESVINDSKPLVMTRNNINRFTAGTKDGALYTEKSYIGGSTTFNYMIDDPEVRDGTAKQELMALKGIMKLVVNDICRGLVSVGGQAAVGRGIFEGQAQPADPDDKCLKALYNEVMQILSSRSDAQESQLEENSDAVQ